MPPLSHGSIARCCAALLELLLTACTTTPQARDETKASAQLRVMAFNVRLPVESDGANRWDARRDLAVSVIRDAAPDLIGTQELFAVQGDYMATHLPGYAWFGRGRKGHARDVGDDEHMGVFYRTDRLRLLDSGDFWLSDTPAVPGSITWGNLFPRLVTWGRFELISDGRRFVLFNTHLPYRDQDEAARVKGAALLRHRIVTLPPGEPVVLTGDFNTTPDGAVHAALLGAGLRDAWDVAPVREGPAGTFHDWSGQGGRRIDWILVRGFNVKGARTVDAHGGGRYPSDHFPVVVDLALP